MAGYANPPYMVLPTPRVLQRGWTQSPVRLGVSGSTFQLHPFINFMNGATYERCHKTIHRLQSRRYVPGCMGTQGTRHCRNRNARPDGNPQGIYGYSTAAWRAHHRLAAHDHPDRCVDLSLIHISEP